MLKKISMLLLCAAGIMLNRVFNRMVLGADLPLYLDTIGTIAVTLTAGPFWGMLTGALTNIIWHSFESLSWGGYLFALCNVATAAATYLFVKFFPDELSPGRVKNVNTGRTFPSKSLRLSAIMNSTIVLLLLSFVLCILMSVLGGGISTLIQFIEAGSLEKWPTGSLTLTLFPSNFPQIFAEILSRIPVNLIDRPITVFAGYALYRFLAPVARRLCLPEEV